jgi:hypothetical protein
MARSVPVNSPGFYGLSEVLGDLFTAPPTDCLAHCVSADFHLSQGIARIFSKKFPEIRSLHGIGVGKIGIVKHGVKFTKSHFYEKPTYDKLQTCLVALRDHAFLHSVSGLSMPRLGCGLDRLDWFLVKKIITDVFSQSPIRLTVNTLER